MGNKLLSFFDKADELGGLPAKIRLAVLCKNSSSKAKSMEDSIENIQNMRKSFGIMSQEFDKANINSVSKATSKATPEDTIKSLRKYISAFSDMFLFQAEDHNLKTSAQQITVKIAESIDVNRASIWLYNEDKSGVVCLNLYEQDKKMHSEGAILTKVAFPKYFKVLGSNMTLAADDAHTHSGTAEFSEVYLKPLGITSMLDVPIFVKGEMAGLICHEHTGPKRKWTSDEENFAYLMSSILGNILEHRK
jgi:hypothetical protein